jgi:hypothetical protein
MGMGFWLVCSETETATTIDHSFLLEKQQLYIRMGSGGGTIN